MSDAPLPPAPAGLARFDSAAAMAQALALFLRGRDFAGVGQGPRFRFLAARANLLPRRARELVYSVGGALEGVPRSRAGALDAGAIARWFADLYPRRRYPAVLVGSSNGALIHLAAAMGAPWLPQTFLTPVRRRVSDPDDARAAMADGREVGAAILAANPEVAVHHMHDPNQDRLMSRAMGYFRLKLRRLPAAYVDFLDACLEPGGLVVLVEGGRRWPVTRLGRHHVFQFGAVGGATVDEYFRGGPRVRAYFERYGSRRERWDPPPSDDEAPEAEWGFEPALGLDVRRRAVDAGWRVARVPFDDPEEVSAPVAELYREWYARRGLAPDRRLLAETFVLLDPHQALALAAVPLWLTFGTEPSAATLGRYLDAHAFDEIDLTLFSHGTEGVGLAPAGRWQALVGRARRQGRLLGADPRAFPRDFATLGRYGDALRRLGPRHELPAPLDPEQALRWFEAKRSGLAAAGEPASWR